MNDDEGGPLSSLLGGFGLSETQNPPRKDNVTPNGPNLFFNNKKQFNKVVYSCQPTGFSLYCHYV